MDEPTPLHPEQPAEEEKGTLALCQITLTFLPDGGIHMGVGGDLRPAFAWAGSEFLRNVGDDMFREARAKVAAELAKTQKRILVPQDGMTRIPR